MDVSLSTCDAIMDENCKYLGDRLTAFEPPVGDIDSIQECQKWTSNFEGGGAAYFCFLGLTEECLIYKNLEAECDTVGGPAVAPPLDECRQGVHVIIY